MVDHQSLRCIYCGGRAYCPNSRGTKLSVRLEGHQFLYSTYKALVRLGSSLEGLPFWSPISSRPWKFSPACSASNPRRGANSMARDSADVIVHVVRGRMSSRAGHEKVSRIHHPSRRRSNLRSGGPGRLTFGVSVPCRIHLA
jgi:hypothetical protein